MNEVRLYVDDRPGENLFRVHGDAFTRPELFELEMKYIFERTWIFLTAESAIAQKHDFFATHIGRTPVLVCRDANGRIGAFINACRHKGATVARVEQGNAKFHVCPYHGWAYDSAGKNVDIKDRQAGAYSPAFDTENHDLLPIARVASYNGLVFGSLSPEVPPLEEYLGEFRYFIDLLMDQGRNGMELIAGRSAYSFNANWKLQMENPLDSYHVDITHAGYLQAAKLRALEEKRKGAGKGDVNRIDYADRTLGEAGVFEFRHGHSVYWRSIDDPAKRPFYPVFDEMRARVGEVKAKWMLPLRNSAVFPSLLPLDTVVPHLRVVRPISVNHTEIRTYSLAPIGEATEMRAKRLRQLEDFLNPSGFATPDDLVLFNECQQGFESGRYTWLHGYERGVQNWKAGGNELSDEMGIKPAASLRGPTQQGCETASHGFWREWIRIMEAGLAGRRAY
jgi:phenylpropionate dioxygenase-like ring-hydroxylating dioxygenase large terminal subunit